MAYGKLKVDTITYDNAGTDVDVLVQNLAGAGSVAPLNSPTFTGTPAAPTAAVGTNTTQLATTAFVVAEIIGSAASWTNISATTNAVAGGKYLADTSSAAFNLNLPNGPSTGDTIQVADRNGSFATNNLTIARAGSPILGVHNDLIANVNHAVITLIYSGNATTGWLVK